MSRAATLTIDLDAICHNYQLAKSLAPAQQQVAVIKANAYGHGAVEVAHRLSPIADAFGVACIEEALELREAGIHNPILLLEGFFHPDELSEIAHHRLWTGLHNDHQLQALLTTELANPVDVWLKLDSGMHRLGFTPEEFPTVFRHLQRHPNVNRLVIMSHLSCADDLDSAETSAQIQLTSAIQQVCPAPVSLANSAGTLMHESSRFDWQRPGIMLYGSSPFVESLAVTKTMRPAMTLTSEIIAIHHLQPGDAIGYNRTWVCDTPTRVGTVALGYADGYPRQAQNGTPVLVNSQPTQLIGRVSMDMLTVDLTNIDADLGSTVELWGDNLSANSVAQHCGTISYHLFTGITNRVHRRYR